jgi:hypothetical protein
MFTKNLIFWMRTTVIFALCVCSWFVIVSAVGGQKLEISEFWRKILLLAAIQTFIAIGFLKPTTTAYVASLMASLATGWAIGATPQFLLGVGCAVLLGQFVIFYWRPAATLPQFAGAIIMAFIAAVFLKVGPWAWLQIGLSFLMGCSAAVIATYCRQHGAPVFRVVKRVQNPILVFVVLYIAIGFGFALLYRCVSLYEPKWVSSVSGESRVISFSDSVLFSFSQLMNSGFSGITVSASGVKILMLTEVFFGLLAFAIYLQLLLSKPST